MVKGILVIQVLLFPVLSYKEIGCSQPVLRIIARHGKPIEEKVNANHEPYDKKNRKNVGLSKTN